MRVIDYLQKNVVPIRKDMPDRGFFIERLIREAYVDIFNISDLDNSSNPYALVEISNVDGARELGPLPSRIREYHLHSIAKMYNLNLIEFLQLPAGLIPLLIDMSVEETLLAEKARRESERKSENNIARELKDVDF